MNNKAQTATLGAIIILVSGVLVAMAMLPTIANNQVLMTDKQTIQNELVNLTVEGFFGDKGEINLTNGSYLAAKAPTPSDWQWGDTCPIESVAFGNASTNYTLTTDYAINLTNGNLTLVNSTAVITGGNDTYLYYKYCDDGYLTDSGSRGVAELILIGAALALLGFAIWAALKNGGWLNS